MGKSIRSKIKKRLRTAKRQRVDAMLVTPRTVEHHENLVRVIQGNTINRAKPKNAFKYPDEPDAVFPQHELMKPIDFRAQSMPMVGLVFRGNRRKYAVEEIEIIDKMKKQHPKMEVLAGGGVIKAKTGQRITKAEAELEAARIQAAKQLGESVNKDASAESSGTAAMEAS